VKQAVASSDWQHSEPITRTLESDGFYQPLFSEIALPHAWICRRSPLYETSSDQPGADFLDRVMLIYLGASEATEECSRDDAVHAFKMVAERLRNPDLLPLDCDWWGDTNFGAAVIDASYDYYSARAADRISSGESQLALDPDAQFAAAIFLGAAMENESWSLFDHSDDQVASLRLGPISMFEPIFQAHGISSFTGNGLDRLKAMHLPPRDHDIFQSWVLRQRGLLVNKVER
jgi:hypothetical protein